MKHINIMAFLVLMSMVFSFSSCLDAEEIIAREAQEKKMLRAAQIVKATPPANIGQVKAISFEECTPALRNELKHIVDVRSLADFNKTHIEGAISIPLASKMFKRNISLLDKDQPLIVYGGHDKNSDKAAKIMQALGFKNIYNLRSSVNECINVKVKLSKKSSKQNDDFQKTFASNESPETYLSHLGTTKNIDINTFKGMLNKSNTILDIRSVSEYVAGHIAGAMHTDWNGPNFITKIINGLSSEKPIAIYGNNHGIDGENAMTLLQALGYTNVYNLAGGVETYSAAGLALEPLKIDGEPLHLTEDEFIKAIVGELGIIVDVRTMGEFDIAHIPTAQLIDVKKRNFKDQFSKLDKGTPVFLYCRTGVRSMKASKIAKELGYNVFNLDHGFKGWVKHHKPIIGEAHNVDNGEEGC